ncbi:MAG: hypothetical protein RDV48_28105 [Candidatus Eremiobacteraeota bacterium]|nr:hypothetical protein [Candidatus Eremiobacteraeota bacterium]
MRIMMPVLLLMAVFLLMTPFQAHACGTCAYQMINAHFPFIGQWFVLFLLWFLIIIVLKAIDGTLEGAAVGQFAIFGFIAFCSGAAMLGPLPFIPVLIYWLWWYGSLFYQKGKTRTEKLALYVTHGLTIALIVSAGLSLNKAADEGIKGKLSRVSGGSMLYGLRSQVAQEKLLSDIELVELAQNGDANQKTSSIAIMGKMKNTFFVPALVEIMQNEKNSNVRTQISSTLKELTSVTGATDSSVFWKNWWTEIKPTWSTFKERRKEEQERSSLCPGP